VATSRRRERELARRRYERRRQLQMERRAKAKKRNTWLGASIGTAAVIAVAVLLIIHFSGSSPKKPAASVSPAAAPTAAATPTPTPTAAAVKAPTKCAKISPNPTAKGQPTIPQPKGKLSKKLVVSDVKKGHGPAAKAGANLSVTYIGVSCDTGKVFDATYKDGGTPFAVTNLGQAQVIDGWNKGLIGVKAGGVRELVIPARLAYKKAGSGTIAPNDTLVFLITVKSVKAA
jgi:FKBP-type peptidyl-prolyl cis-trans isomerase